jgi:tRNA G46 methylase TrmB
MSDLTHSQAREVHSNQEGPFKDLEKLVRKYACTPYLRPIADHTRLAFADAEQFIADFYTKRHAGSAPHPVILDSGCGTGESTLHLAHQFPGYPVIGIDKSAVRLDKANKNSGLPQPLPHNAFYVRAELIDFWRLALEKVVAGQWTIPYHALYYPNPWPKQSEAGRRFHLHPIFPTFLRLAHTTELRTNWEIYAQEFSQAARIIKEIPGQAGDDNVVSASISCEAFEPKQPITAFERKYKNACQQLWQVIISQ